MIQDVAAVAAAVQRLSEHRGVHRGGSQPLVLMGPFPGRDWRASSRAGFSGRRRSLSPYSGCFPAWRGGSGGSVRSAEAGDILAGRYRLRAVIGRGGMGVIWLAGDELLHRDVAVKEILWLPQLGAEEREKFRQRALREARTAARLNHLNVVRVYDVIEDDGRPWTVMQLVPYPSLGDVVHADGPLPPERAARAGLPILDAIRAEHAVAVRHP